MNRIKGMEERIGAELRLCLFSILSILLILSNSSLNLSASPRLCGETF